MRARHDMASTGAQIRTRNIGCWMSVLLCDGRGVLVQHDRGVRIQNALRV
jgi:hypothetical protein